MTRLYMTSVRLGDEHGETLSACHYMAEDAAHARRLAEEDFRKPYSGPVTPETRPFLERIEAKRAHAIAVGFVAVAKPSKSAHPEAYAVNQ